MTNRRWDGDTRGAGEASAAGQVPAVHNLMDAMLLPDWVAEQPEAHLLPHIRALCEQATSPFRIASTATDGATFVVTLEWKRPRGQMRQVTAAAFALIGAFAETSTFVREASSDSSIDFEVTTGLLNSDSQFKGHGHVVHLRITGSAIEAILHRRT